MTRCHPEARKSDTALATPWLDGRIERTQTTSGIGRHIQARTQLARLTWMDYEMMTTFDLKLVNKLIDSKENVSSAANVLLNSSYQSKKLPQ
jgi:hypothetical protein